MLPYHFFRLFKERGATDFSKSARGAEFWMLDSQKGAYIATLLRTECAR
jgi:hypothetical protein